jgi:HK97 family phage portal protein
MGFLDRLFSWTPEDARPTNAPVPGYSPPANVQAYSSWNLAEDVGFPEFMRGGHNLAGAVVNRRHAMRNTSVRRSVNLISNVMGTLPLHLMMGMQEGEAKKATDHPLFKVLWSTPNTQQDAFQFRKLLQRWALIDGNGYAQILRSRGNITGLLPIHPDRVEKRIIWGADYKVLPPNGAGTGRYTVPVGDMLHIMGDTDDGLNGIALVDEAADALGISLQADKAAARLFKQGALIRDVLSTDKKLSPQAIANLKSQLDEQFGGAENAAKTLVAEEGLKYSSVVSNARESQHLETRQHQIEEIARVFGMPRPFLMMDDTSWGSGIEQLGIFFVTYTLSPWLSAWEKAISRVLLTETERKTGFYPKFNERALLRGSMKDQAEFFFRMMGAGGTPQIFTQNEARALLDMPAHADGDGLSSGLMTRAAAQGAADGSSSPNPA